MKLGTAIGTALLALGAGLGWMQYRLVQDAHANATRLIARVMPQGELRYARLWPFLWGGGRVWDISFQPEGLLRLSLQLPPGVRMQARELHVHTLRRAADGTLEQLGGTLLGVRVPAVGALSGLQLETLEFDLAFDLRYVREASLALITLDASGANLGHALIEAQLEGTPETFGRAQDQIVIRKASLRFADGGLLSRYKDAAAAQARLSRSAWETDTIARLDHRAQTERWQWDADTARALRAAIRDAGAWRAEIDPPSDVALRDIRLYALADWPRLLGFRFALEAGETARSR